MITAGKCIYILNDKPGADLPPPNTIRVKDPDSVNMRTYGLGKVRGMPGRSGSLSGSVTSV